FFFSSRRRHTRSKRDWSSDVCSSDLGLGLDALEEPLAEDAAAADGHETAGLLPAHPLWVEAVVEDHPETVGHVGRHFVQQNQGEIGRASCRERVWRAGTGLVVYKRHR